MDLASRARIGKPANIDRLLEYGKRAHEAKETGQNDLFGGQNEPPPLELEEAEPWTYTEALEAEREAVGFYLSGHPLDKHPVWITLEYVELMRRNDEIYGHRKPVRRKSKYAKSR